MKITTALFALSIGVLPVAAQVAGGGKQPAFNTSTTSVVPQMVDGGLTRSILIVTNMDPNNSANYKIDFYGDNGQPLSFSFNGVGVVNTISGTAPAGASIFYQTNSGTSAPTVQGYAMKDSSGTDGTIGVTQLIDIYSPTTGQFNSETSYDSIPSSFSSPVGFPFDNMNGNISSMAIANTTSSGTQTVNVTVVDTAGNVLGTHALSLTAMNHMAFILSSQWPETVNARGTIIFQPTSSGNTVNMAMMGLRFASIANGFTVTALPVLTRQGQ